jgi:hypothetical protein
VLVQQNRVAFNHRFDGRFITAFHPLSLPRSIPVSAWINASAINDWLPAEIVCGKALWFTKLHGSWPNVHQQQVFT